jgi:hypothetical protein
MNASNVTDAGSVAAITPGSRYLLRPSAIESLRRGIGDATRRDEQRWASGPIRAGQAAAARAMNVEERDTIPLSEGTSGRVVQASANAIEHAGRHMARNDRIRHTAQASVPEVHVRTADLGEGGPQHGRTRRQIRLGEFPDFDGLERRRHDGS